MRSGYVRILPNTGEDHMKKLGYSISTLCESTEVGKDTVYQAINSGELKSVKLGRRRIIRTEAAEEWLKNLEKRTSRKMGFEDS